MTQLPPDELAALPLRWMRMTSPTVLELGNKKNKTGLYRDWYERQGMKYICLDYNGEDGAIPLDMRYALTPEDIHPDYAAGFPLVTNFGFTEHVDGQMACWSNVHDFVQPGGFLAICMPLMPEWKGHGLWMPTPDWYREFANLNGYHIEFQKVWDRVRPTFVCLMHKTGTCDIFEMPVGMIEASGGTS